MLLASEVEIRQPPVMIILPSGVYAEPEYLRFPVNVDPLSYLTFSHL